MKLEETLQDLIEKMIKKELPLFITEGEVTSVDKGANTCDVNRGELSELKKARLNAILEAGQNVITVYPSVGSKVLCALIENNPTDAFVLSTNNIDEIIINGGNNGGMSIVGKILEKLNNLENAFNAHMHATAAVGPPSIPTPIPDVIPLTSTVLEEIENTKIKH